MINWHSRFRNKQFLAAIASLVIMLIKNTMGYDFISEDIDMIVDLVLTGITSIGVIVDPSTGGWTDAIEFSDPKMETFDAILDSLKDLTGEDRD